MRTYFLFFIFIITEHWVFSQSESSYDGLTLKPSPNNRYLYYYGEQVYVFFDYSNTENVVKKYSTYLNSGMDVFFLLKDLKTGKMLFSSYGPHIHTVDGSELTENGRKNLKNGKVPEEYWFKPKLSLTALFNVNEYYGSDLFLDSSAYKYRTLPWNEYLKKGIPPGEYELTMRIDLLPSEGQLFASHCFKVAPLPVEEQIPFKEFLKTAYYFYKLCTNEYHTTSAYDAAHPHSAENFVKNYPNSRFAPWAVYFYGVLSGCVTADHKESGPGEKSIQAKKYFMDYYSRLNDDMFKMLWATQLPNIITHYYDDKNKFGGDWKKSKPLVRQALDEFLTTKMKDDEYNSQVLINSASLSSIKADARQTDLVNYARQRNQNKAK